MKTLVWPRLTPQSALALLAGVTLIRLIVAATAPLSADEAYYWVWSRALAPGYLDHPPMVALWIRAGTTIAGQGPLGVRLLGPLSAALGSVLLWRAAHDLLNDAAQALRSAVLLNATLLFGAGAVTMTPDTPLLFFWTVALWAMARLIATGQWRWWLAAGAACGLAMSSKYTAILFPAGIAVWLAAARGAWRWLPRPAPWLAALIAGAVFTPTLLWNAAHRWASFAKQGGRTFDFHPGAVLGHLGELIAGQAALATPLIFVLCAVGAAAVTRLAVRTRAPGPVLLACLCIPAAILFAEHALGDRVQANWPAILYPAAAIAAGVVSQRWRRLYVPAVALGTLVTALVYLQSTAAPFPVSRHIDPTLRLSGGFAQLAADLQAQAVRTGAQFIAVDDYGSASELAFLRPACTKLVALEPRWSLFDLPDGASAMDGRPGLLLRLAHRTSEPARADWASLTEIGTLARLRGGRVAETYSLYQGIGRAGPEASVLLPCRHG